MNKQPKLKLSELPDDVEVSFEGSSTIYTVAELKREIAELREPHHETKGWCVISREKWYPSAENMLETYTENSAEELWEDAEETIRDAIAGTEQVAAIQAIFDTALPDGLDYWVYGKDVEIDIFPPGEVESIE